MVRFEAVWTELLAVVVVVLLMLELAASFVLGLGGTTAMELAKYRSRKAAAWTICLSKEITPGFWGEDDAEVEVEAEVEMSL